MTFTAFVPTYCGTPLDDGYSQRVGKKHKSTDAVWRHFRPKPGESEHVTTMVGSRLEHGGRCQSSALARRGWRSHASGNECSGSWCSRTQRRRLSRSGAKVAERFAFLWYWPQGQRNGRRSGREPSTYPGAARLHKAGMVDSRPRPDLG